MMLLNKKRVLTSFSVLALLLATLLYLRPYYGIRHDSILYLGQAYLKMAPESFGRDLFFFYGSQASFTLFPMLLGVLLRFFSAPALFQILTLLSLFAFMLASATFARILFPWEKVLWSLLSLLVVPAMYGGFGVFSYSEGFFTARSLAEPLLILSMGIGIRRNYSLAAVLWLMAAFLHPLQSLAVLVIAWFWLVSEDRRWLATLPLAVLGAASLAVADAIWGTRFFARYDGEWLSWIQEPNQHVFLSLWDFHSWVSLGSELFLLFLVAMYFEGVHRRIALVLMASAITGCGLSLILVDGLKLVLPTSLQLWRVTWVVQWWVALMLPHLLVSLYRKANHVSVEVLIVVIVVALGFTQGVVPPYAVLLLIPIYFVFEVLRDRLAQRTRRLTEVGLWLALLVITIKYFLFGWDLYSKSASNWNSVRLDFVLLTFPLFSGVALLIGISLWRRGSWLLRAGLSCLLAGLLVFSAASWDQRSDWTRYIESRDSISPFSVSLRSGAQVYWQGELLAPWLILKRPSYFNDAQGAGLLFNRGTAAEFYRRRKVIELLDMQSQVCELVNGVTKSKSCVIDASALRDACDRGRGQLDYLILSSRVAGYEQGSWLLSRSKMDSYAYYLYDCKVLGGAIGQQGLEGANGALNGR